MKIIKKMIIALLLVVSLNAQTAIPPSAGDGTESDPYQISSLSNLYWISADSSNWDKHYIQTADINISECRSWKDSMWTGYEDQYDYYYGWTSIANPFTGSYDGQFYVIDSLKINFYSFSNSTSNQGLFRYAKNASISNLGLTHVDIYNVQSMSSTNIGSLIGYSDSCTITNCFSQGYINSMKRTGGLIGNLQNSTINNCYTKGTVIGSEYAGGIAGYWVNFLINNCYTNTSVRLTLEHGIGPITAYKDNSTVNKCYSIGSAYDQMDDRIFGIAGLNCFWEQWFTYPLEYTQLSYGGNKRTSTEMKNPDLYLNAGWDFVIETENGTEDIWDIDTSGVINNGYPFLLWEHTDTTCFTDVEEISIPENYLLSQNYPNPFNPMTTIGYQLPAVSDVQLMIFDISGRKINQWPYQNQFTGTYEITWNGRDQAGNQVPSGVYIYRMVAGEFIESKKMVLLK